MNLEELKEKEQHNDNCAELWQRVGDFENEVDQLKGLLKASQLLNTKASSKIRILYTALRVYSDKRNWTRDKDGHLNIFMEDTNGPYRAIKALKDFDDVNRKINEYVGD
jgi:hypothetical protein